MKNLRRLPSRVFQALYTDFLTGNYEVVSCIYRPREGFFSNKPAAMTAFFTYLKNARAELQFVVWPTPRQAMMYVALIVLISVFTALFISALDFVFSRGLAFLLTR